MSSSQSRANANANINRWLETNGSSDDSSDSEALIRSPARLDPMMRTRRATAVGFREIVSGLSTLGIFTVHGAIGALLRNFGVETQHINRDSDVYMKAYAFKRVENAFTPWVSLIPEFLDMMRRSRSVVGGGLAISTVLESVWVAQNLDLFVARGERHRVASYLIAVESYVFDHATDGRSFHDIIGLASNANAGFHVLQSVTHLRKSVLVDGFTITRWIKIFESVTFDCLFPISYSHSTWSMTWITSDSIVVAYPELTSRGKGMHSSIYFTVFPDTAAGYLNKWSERGFNIVPRIQTDLSGQPCGAICPVVLRSTHDRYVFRMSFNRMVDVMPQQQWMLKARLVDDPCTNQRCPQYGSHSIIANAAL